MCRKTSIITPEQDFIFVHFRAILFAPSRLEPERLENMLVKHYVPSHRFASKTTNSKLFMSEEAYAVERFTQNDNPTSDTKFPDISLTNISSWPFTLPPCKKITCILNKTCFLAQRNAAVHCIFTILNKCMISEVSHFSCKLK